MSRMPLSAADLLPAALAAAALSLPLAGAAAADDKAAALKPGAEASGAVATDQKDEKHVARFSFTVPENALMARLDVEGRADVDLFVARKPIDDPEDWIERTDDAERDTREHGRPRRFGREAAAEDADPLRRKRIEGKILLDRSASDTGTERVTILRDGGDLEPGEHFVAVSYRRLEPPKSPSGEEVEKVEFKVKLTLVTTRVDAKLEAGKAVSGAIEPDEGPFRTYTIDVPATAPALRLDLFDAPQDLNLRVRKGKAIVVGDDADDAAETGVGTEQLVIEPDEETKLEGTWFVEVVEPNGLDFSTPFKLRASFAKDPDPSLLVLPRPPAAKTPVERASAGVVEILALEGGGGSGVLISEKGYAITNYHVVQEEAEGEGKVGQEMLVALTLDPRDPAHEAFKAKVVAVAKDLDLALVRCEAGLYGQPIPSDYRFPTVPLGAAEKLTLGDPLYAVGYPALGGTGSRATITVTRGVVSGFERRGGTLHLKTDAMVSPGNSGGAAMNERYELVGFATETLSDGDTSGLLAFVRPLWLVPPDWWTKAGVPAPKKMP